MLVLSRRPGDEIAIPALGIRIKILTSKTGLTKVGVEAPPEIRVIRGEVAPENPTPLEVMLETRLPQDHRHRIRGHLQAVNLGLEAIRSVWPEDDAEGFDEALETAIGHLRAIASDHTLQAKSDSAHALSVAIIEDQPNERALLAGMLRGRGHEVVAFEDGEDALDFYATEPAPSAFLIDMTTPRWGGEKTIDVIRSNSRFSDSRIAVISASEPASHGFDDNDRRIDRWFVKPIEAAAIANSLAMWSHST